MKEICSCCGRPMPKKPMLDEAVRRYMAGEKQVDLAREYGFGRSDISKHLVELRRKGEFGIREKSTRGRKPKVGIQPVRQVPNSVFALGAM